MSKNLSQNEISKLLHFIFILHRIPLVLELGLSFPTSCIHPRVTFFPSESLRSCTVVRLHSGWFIGWMPIVALMTLFSSGVRGERSVAGLYLTGAAGSAPCQQQSMGKINKHERTALSKNAAKMVSITWPWGKLTDSVLFWPVIYDNFIYLFFHRWKFSTRVEIIAWTA